MKKLIVGGALVLGFLFLIVAVLQLLVALSANISEGVNSKPEENINVELESIADNLKIDDLVMTETDNGQVITGIIQNNSDDVVRGIHVIVSLYDKENNKIGEASDYSGRLKKSGKWKFEAVSFDEKAKDFEVDIEVLD